MGTEQISAAERAARIADMVGQVARERADNQHPDDWTYRQSFDDYVYTIRSVEARLEGPRHARVVVVWPRIHPHDGYWTNIASEVLDSAADRVDTELGDDFTLSRYQIVGEEDDYEARLVPLEEQEQHDCGECGAAADEECVEPNCQGSWV